MRWPAAVHAASAASSPAAEPSAAAASVTKAAATAATAIPAHTTAGRAVPPELPAVALVDHIALAVVAFHDIRVQLQLRLSLSEPDVLFEQPVERTLVSVYRRGRLSHAARSSGRTSMRHGSSRLAEHAASNEGRCCHGRQSLL